MPTYNVQIPITGVVQLKLYAESSHDAYGKVFSENLDVSRGKLLEANKDNITMSTSGVKVEEIKID